MFHYRFLNFLRLVPLSMLHNINPGILCTRILDLCNTCNKLSTLALGLVPHLKIFHPLQLHELTLVIVDNATVNQCNLTKVEATTSTPQSGRQTIYTHPQSLLHLHRQQQRDKIKHDPHVLLEARKDIVQQHKQYNASDIGSIKRLLTRYDYYINHLEFSGDHKLATINQKMSSHGFSFTKSINSISPGSHHPEIQPFLINYHYGVFLWSGYEPILFAMPPLPISKSHMHVFPVTANPTNYYNSNSFPRTFQPTPTHSNNHSPTGELFGDLLFPADSKIETYLVLGDKKKISPLFLSKNMMELTNSIAFELYMCYYNRGALLYNTFFVMLREVLPQDMVSLDMALIETSYMDLKQILIEAVCCFKKADTIRTDLSPTDKTAFNSIMSNYDGIDHVQGLMGLIDCINDGIGQLLVSVKIQNSLIALQQTMQQDKDIDLYFSTDTEGEDENYFFETLLFTQQSTRIVRKKWDEFNGGSGTGLKNFFDTEIKGTLISGAMKIIDYIYRAVLVACNYWRLHVANQITKSEYDAINGQFTGINQHQGNVRFMFAQKLLVIAMKLVHNLPYNATNQKYSPSFNTTGNTTTTTTFESIMKGLSNLTTNPKLKNTITVDGIDMFSIVGNISTDIKKVIELINSANEMWSLEPNKDSTNVTQILLDRAKIAEPFSVNEKTIDQYTLIIGPLSSDYLFSVMTNHCNTISHSFVRQPQTMSDLAEQTIHYIGSLTSNDPALGDKIINYLIPYINASQQKNQ